MYHILTMISAGAFAVTTRVYLKAYPSYHAINTVGGGIVCENKDSYSNVISAMVDLQLPLRDANQSVCRRILGSLRYSANIKTGYLGDRSRNSLHRCAFIRDVFGWRHQACQ